MDQSIKKQIDKTLADWISEWISSLFISRKFIILLGALFGGTYLVNLYIVQIPVPQFAQYGVAVLIFPFAVVAIILFFVRTIGLIYSFLHPSIQATDVVVNNQKIIITKLNLQKDEFDLRDVEYIFIIYNFRGFSIKRRGIYFNYELPREPRELEEIFNVLNLKKDTSFLDSKEGKIKYIYFRNNPLSSENSK